MFVNEKLEQFKKEIKGKRVAVIGFGVSNIPLVSYLIELNIEICVFDKRTEDKLDQSKFEEYILKGVKFYLGDEYLKNLVGFDYIFRSPSMRPDLPEVVAKVSNGTVLTSEIEMLMNLCPSKVIGITGSDGKTTTTTLINLILKEEGYNTYLGGNIGIPLFDKIDYMTPDDVIVLELSSFQLMTFKKSPQIAVCTNIAPNHLDIHKDYDEYINAKKNIFLYQNEDSLAILNYDNEITKGFESDIKGRVRFFSTQNELANGVIFDETDGNIYIYENGDKRVVINENDIKLIGRHMIEDCCAAVAAVKDMVSISSIKKVLSTFNGVEHRNELVRVLNGVTWRNDSIGSSPSRTIAGLKSFKDKVILIAGGYDKHLDYSPMSEYLATKVKALILLGQTSEKIKLAAMDGLKVVVVNQNEYPIIECSSLEEAVQKAYEIAKDGDTVFFSPASASFDMFKNFEERGNKFKELVNNF